METPPELRAFNCDDYFSSTWSAHGYWDEASQLMMVLPVGQHFVREDLNYLVVGNAGVDGLEFGYRCGLQGLWTYQWLDREFVRVAESISDLVDGYTSGRITV